MLKKIKCSLNDKIVEYDVLYEYEDNETNKKYIFLTDNNDSSTNQKEVMIASYEINNNRDDIIKLFPVTDDEKKELQELFETAIEMIKNGEI